MHLLSLLLGLMMGASAQPPAAAPVLSPAVVVQGGMARIGYPVPVGRSVTAASLQVESDTIRCGVLNGTVVGLFGVSVKRAPGKYTATLQVQYEGGGREQFPLAYTVKAGAFPTQRIRMARSKMGLMSNSVLEKERAALYQAMEGTADHPLWTGAFRWPLKGRISVPFGRKRFVNGESWGQHGGIDIAVPAGTPVRAANDGRVLLARKLWIGGNVMMIDHGLGVFTLYEHLSRMDLRPGQEIRKGQVIGLAGATGFATGPHLHWETRVYHTPVDPAGPVRAGIPLPVPRAGAQPALDKL